MGTHPIFESDFDCLTDIVSDGEFWRGFMRFTIMMRPNHQPWRVRSTFGIEKNSRPRILVCCLSAQSVHANHHQKMKKQKSKTVRRYM